MTWEGCLTSRCPDGAGVPTAAPLESSVLAAWASALLCSLFILYWRIVEDEMVGWHH